MTGVSPSPASQLRATMSSIERRGRWVVPRELSVVVTWGNAHLDLRDAVLPPEGATIDVRVVMGNLEIVVPPGLRVDVAVQAIAGNVEDKRAPTSPIIGSARNAGTSDEPLAAPYRTAPAGKTVRITGLVKLGNCEILELAYGQSVHESSSEARGLACSRRKHRHRYRHLRRAERARWMLDASAAPWLPWWLHSRLRRRIFSWFAVTLAAGVWVGIQFAHQARWWLAAIALVGVAAISAAVAWRLTQPLLMVIRAARDIGDGNLDTRLVPPGRGEMRLLATAINEMADKLQRQRNDQRHLLAAVSHELRTPLGHMRVLIETARDTGGDRALSELEREVLLLDDLVGKLLASSRLEFGNLERRPVDLGELAADTATACGVAPECVEAHGDVAVAVDPTLVRRAIANLIDNAQLHGGGTTAIRIERRGGHVAIEVDDAGPGVPNERRADAFTAFVPSSGGGLGLGLSLVSRIAAAHGGAAFMDDRPGGGARVGFTVSTK